MDLLSSLKAQIRSDESGRDARIGAFVARLERILAKDLRRIARSMKTDADAFEAAAVFNQLRTTLEQMGLGSHLAQIAEVYNAEITAIRQQFETVGYTAVYGGADRDLALLLIDADFDAIDNAVNSYLGDFRQQVLREIVVGVEPDYDELADRIGTKAAANVETELNTGTMAFNRTITAKKAIDLQGENPRFVYVGPYDKVTRDFCRGVLTDKSPAIYTLREIEAMDNEQGLPVMAYGGGYNCRHRWVPVSDELAQELGADDSNIS